MHIQTQPAEDPVIEITGGEKSQTLAVKRGQTLRDILIAHGYSPHQGIWATTHCRGMGLCGSCEVLVQEDGKWQPRRSCQIRCYGKKVIRLQ